MLNVTISEKITLKYELIQKYFPCKRLLFIFICFLYLRSKQLTMFSMRQRLCPYRLQLVRSLQQMGQIYTKEKHLIQVRSIFRLHC